MPAYRLILALLLFSLTAGLAPAQISLRGRVAATGTTANYFPLEVGNSWTYQWRGAAAQGSASVKVTGQREMGGLVYYSLEGYTPEPAWVRTNDRGQLVEFRPETGAELLWYDFGAPLGMTWEPQLPVDCLGQATISSRSADMQTPAGDFSGALVVTYGPTECADAGFVEEAFVPRLGLVRRIITTIAGPREMVLLEATLGTTTIQGSRVSVTLALDRPLYVANLMPPTDPSRSIPRLRAELIVENTTDFEWSLTFPSGQRFDFEIRNPQDMVVYRWSDGRFFTQAVGTIDLSPGKQVFSVEIPLSDETGQPLAAGSYTIGGWLTTGSVRSYGALSGFEIEHVF